MRHLGVLARIQLSDEEVTSLTRELDVIVENIAKVSEVASADVPATSHPIPMQNVYRPDEVGYMLSTEEALQNAPDRDGDRFRVTAILGEEQ